MVGYGEKRGGFWVGIEGGLWVGKGGELRVGKGEGNQWEGVGGVMEG